MTGSFPATCFNCRKEFRAFSYYEYYCSEECRKEDEKEILEMWEE